MDIRDVARHAGVSIATVSRVLNNSAKVSDELRSRVLEAVEELDFRPDHLARSLRNRQTSIVGIIIPDISNPFFPLIARGAEDVLRRADISLMIFNSDQKPATELQAVEMMLAKKVDGILFVGTGADNEAVTLMRASRTPVVYLDRSEEGRVASVVTDNYGGMTKIMMYMLELGHTSFWYLGGPPLLSTAVERKRAVIDFSRQHKHISLKVHSGHYTYEWAFSKASELLEAERTPHAIIAGNDLMAMGVIDACTTANLVVPDDVSVTGFDDIFFASHFNPPLTTIRQLIYKLGALGAKLLREYIKGTRKKPVSRVLEVELVVRASTSRRSM